MALVQDAFELGHAVRARPLEGDLVGDADDLHGSRVTGDFTVRDGDHVIQAQRLGCNNKDFLCFYSDENRRKSVSSGMRTLL